MANWRDKNQNKSEVIDAGGAAQYTGATAVGYPTLRNGTSIIKIPANTLSVGDSVHVDLLYGSTYSADSWEMRLLYDRADTTKYLHRNVMTSADEIAHVVLMFAVKDATTLVYAPSNQVIGEVFIAGAVNEVTHDITTDLDMEFYVLAGGPSGSNTFDIYGYEVRHVKA